MAEPHRIELLAARLWHVLQDDSYFRAAQAFAQHYADYVAGQKQREVVARLAALLDSY